MKKTIATIFALGALSLAAAPAMAQPYGGDHRGDPGVGRHDDRGPGMDRHDDRGWGDLRARVDAVLAKVDRAMHSDRLTRSERDSLSYRARKLSILEHRYDRGFMRPYERADLERQVNDLDARVDRAMMDDHHGGRWDHRGDRH